jgi:septal ring factor EnvC (AmiA/AmiB activator)
MEDLKMDKEYVVFLKEYLLEQYELRNQDRKLVVKNIEKEILDVDKNINNVLNSFASTQSEIVRRKLEQKIEDLEYRKQMLQNQNVLGTKERDFKKTLDYACMVFENPYRIRKECSIDDKRTFLKLVFRNNLKVNKKLEDF